jgi:hypothetical protein
MNQLIYEDVNFEMCCIMFNIGIAHAQIAASETRTEMDVYRNCLLNYHYCIYFRLEHQKCLHALSMCRLAITVFTRPNGRYSLQHKRFRITIFIILLESFFGTHLKSTHNNIL